PVATLLHRVERPRGDPAGAALHARLRPKSTESTGDTGLTFSKVDTGLATYVFTSFYSDLTVPPALGTVTALVQVPSTVVGGTPGLHEDAVAPRYGLPYDLNGDGTIDGNARDADYVALPVVVRLRWKRAGQQ